MKSIYFNTLAFSEHLFVATSDGAWLMASRVSPNQAENTGAAHGSP